MGSEGHPLLKRHSKICQPRQIQAFLNPVGDRIKGTFEKEQNFLNCRIIILVT
jgi:hypothetical protein